MCFVYTYSASQPNAGIDEARGNKTTQHFV